MTFTLDPMRGIKSNFPVSVGNRFNVVFYSRKQ
jgi:hypothetical protein